MRRVSIDEIINCLKSQYLGVTGNTANKYIDNLADIEHVNATTLDWVNPTKPDKQIIVKNSKAQILLVDDSISPIEGKVLIRVKNPKVALATIGNTFFVQRPSSGIHPTAVVDKDAVIEEGVYIGPYAVIGKAKIGARTIVSANVKIYDNVQIGHDCYIKEGCIIGGEGFGFERDEEGNRFRFPQIGGVVIGDYVEIGGNCCIDRGALSTTKIEDYVKINNLCHIAHNNHIRKNAVIAACVEISGSCDIGENTWVAPKVCIRDQRTIGANSIVGMGSVVVKNIPDNEVWVGNPARKLKDKMLK